MSNLTFTEIRPRIIAALQTRQVYLAINEPITLIDGFFQQPIQNEISGNMIIGGPAIPMIMVVGNNSGRLYYFALKHLLPDLNI